MLVTRQKCTKMLRNRTFVVQFAYFSFRPRAIIGTIMALASDPKNVFEQLFNNVRYKKQVLIAF